MNEIERFTNHKNKGSFSSFVVPNTFLLFTNDVGLAKSTMDVDWTLFPSEGDSNCFFNDSSFMMEILDYDFIGGEAGLVMVTQRPCCLIVE